MRVLLLSRYPEEILPAIAEAGMEVVDHDPQVCVCYGGDGTLLGAERDFPGVPKVPIRNRHRAGVLGHAEHVALLRRVVEGTARITRLPKLRALASGEELLAINDVIIRNSNITSAVRFSMTVDGIKYFDEIVGDGLVVSTPFGSTAYYRSITNSIIHAGIGVAFNNSTEPVNHLVLGSDSRIRIEITRGPALFAADNNPTQIPLTAGDAVELERSSEEAVIYEIQNLMNMQTPALQNERRLRWLHSIRRSNGESE